MKQTKETLLDLFIVLAAFVLLVFTLGCEGLSGDTKYYKTGGCTIERVQDGQILTCDGEVVHIPDQLDIIEVVDPCGDGPGVDELVLLLEGDLYLAWYKSIGIVALEENKAYVTTDSQRCRFQIVNGQVEEL